MSLLTDFVAGSLDPSYAAAAARRRAAAADDPPVESARELRRPAVVLTAVLVGVLFAVSWSNVQATTSVVSRARAQLIEQITQRQQHGDDTAQTIQQLRAEIARARASALTTAGQGTLLGQISTLEQAAAAQAVRGPGVVVSLDDAPGSDDDAGQQRGGSAFSKNRVQAADLQLVVNGLWAAGAEAIAVNDQRLTSRSAIRFAGEAILVDFRPLARPYAVVALGNPTTMASGLGTSAVGSYLKSLTDNYGIRVTVTSSSTLSCPAGPLTDLRHAQTGTGGIPSSGAATSTPPPTTRPTSTSRSTSKATRR